MDRQHRRWLSLLCCLAAAVLLAVPVLATGADTPGVDTPGVDTPFTDAPGANAPFTDVSETEPITEPVTEPVTEPITEPVTEPTEGPVEVPDDPPRDGDWCADEENHWRADAVNQGVPTPHVDADGDGVCDVCRWILGANAPLTDAPGTDAPETEPVTEPAAAPADPAEPAPQTGDRLPLLLCALLLSAAALTGAGRVAELRAP